MSGTQLQGAIRLRPVINEMPLDCHGGRGSDILTFKWFECSAWGDQNRKEIEYCMMITQNS